MVSMSRERNPNGATLEHVRRRPGRGRAMGRFHLSATILAQAPAMAATASTQLFDKVRPLISLSGFRTGRHGDRAQSRRSPGDTMLWKDDIPIPTLASLAGLVEPPASEIILATLLPAPLACCRWELAQRHMTQPSNFALRIVVEEDPRLVRSLNAHYADAAPDGGLDVVERDALLDVLGKHFTGRPWPRSGGVDASRQFMSDLQRAMIRAGWKVDLFAVV